jgi:hypothetical protein
MLNLVEYALIKDGFNSQRIDGQTSLNGRSEAIREFNEDPTCTIMLATIGSAGEGYLIHFAFLFSFGADVVSVLISQAQITCISSNQIGIQW